MTVSRKAGKHKREQPVCASRVLFSARTIKPKVPGGKKEREILILLTVKK